MKYFERSSTFSVGTYDLSEFDYSFDVERSVSKQPNKAVFKVYNLPPNIRQALLQDTSPLCALSAGYVEQVKRIYTGKSREIVHTREGGDILTTITCGDGEIETQELWVAKSFAPKTPFLSVFTALLDGLGVPGSTQAKAFLSSFLAGQTTNTGMVFAGPPAKELASICKVFGLQWSIQNGQVWISKIGEPYLDVAFVLDATSGLVDPPPTLSPKGELQASSLLNPDIVPGVRVQIKSEFVTCDGLVEKVNYVGDKRGSAWYCGIEGKRL